MCRNDATSRRQQSSDCEILRRLHFGAEGGQEAGIENKGACTSAAVGSADGGGGLRAEEGAGLGLLLAPVQGVGWTENKGLLRLG